MVEEEYFEEAVFSDSETEESEETLSVDDDEITPEEEGFMRGYNEADKVAAEKRAEAEEEELE